jgi:membrane-bound lytic murein transglycosylase D
MTVSQLARMNHVSTRVVLQPGQRLQVAGSGGSAGGASAQATQQVAATGGKLDYRVRRGDTLSGIARRFAVTVRDLQAWNNMGRSTSLRAGQSLTIHVGGGNVGG